LQKITEQIENQYVNSNATIDGIADNLATYHLLYGDVNLIIPKLKSTDHLFLVKKLEIAKKYLNPNQRLVWIMFHLKTKLKTKISHYEKSILIISLVLNSTYARTNHPSAKNLSSPTVKLKTSNF
jgi:hypothetical protein